MTMSASRCFSFSFSFCFRLCFCFCFFFYFVSGKLELELELELEMELEDSVSTCRHVIGGRQTYGSGGTSSRSALGLVVVHWLEHLT